MKVLATVLFAWAAVNFVQAATYGYLASLRRLGREYLTFAILTFAMGVYCMGGAMLALARDGFEAATAQTIQFLGTTSGLAAFGPFVYALAGRPSALGARLSIAWGIASAVANLAGLFFDPAMPIRSDAPIFPFLPPTHEVSMQPVGLFSVCGSVGILVWSMSDVVHVVPRGTDGRAVWVASLVGAPAWMMDTFARLTHRPTVYLLEHFVTIGSVFIGYLLIRRYVDADDELQRRTEELRRAYEELRNVQDELVRKEQLAAVGELSAVIAHEVRNPLAILKNAVSGLRRADLGDENRKTLLGILDEETDRLNRLVRDLLAYARPITPQASPVALPVLLEKAVGSAQHAIARATPIDVQLDLERAPASVEGDRDLLDRVFVNIVENALQAMPNGGRLSVVAERVVQDGEEVAAIRIRDTGEGMDTLVRSRATEPFFTTRPSGTGLGLAIVERVVTAHGGSVRFARNDDTPGTTVSVVLPVRRRSSTPPPVEDEDDDD